MLLANSAAGGTATTAVTTGNSGGTSGAAWDAVNAGGSGSFTYDTTHAHSGALAYKVVTDAAANVILTWDTALGGTKTELWGRCYVFLTEVPANNIALIWLRTSGNVNMGRVRIAGSTGVVDVTDASNTVVQAGTVQAATGQWIRIEWHAIAHATAGTLTASLYNTPDSGTATETVGGTGTVALAAAGVDRVHYGRVAASSPPTFWLDDLAVSDVAALGPSLRSGGGTLTATAALTGAGTKIGTGGGTLAATAVLSGSGEDITPTPAVFPDAPLDVRAELYVGGAWVDTIDKALKRDPVTITRGRGDETASPSPSKATLSLRDQDGKWSNRNPRSIYHGLLGRNTPLRIRVGEAPPYAYLPGGTGNYLSTPDTSGLDTTDLDVRAEVTPDTWLPGTLGTIQGYILAAKYVTTGNQRSWLVNVQRDGKIRLRWSTNGTTTTTATSTEPVDVTSPRLAVRVTLDTDNGAGGRTATFYTAAAIGGTWTQLGDPVTAAGTTSVYAGTAPLEIGSASLGGGAFSDFRTFHGKVHAFELRDGIGGTAIADPGIGDRTEAATEWEGADGATWTAGGLARFMWPARFYGEVASWPPSWHTSGGDVRVQLQAAGVRRRLQQGTAPVQSPLRRSLPALPGVVAYWPMEDTGGSFASAFPGLPPLHLNRNASGIDYAADDVFGGSAPLPSMGTGRLVGAAPGFTPQPGSSAFVLAEQTVMLLLHMPGAALGGARRILTASTTGTAARWDLWYSTSNQLGVSVYDREGTKTDENFSGIPVHGRALRVSFILTQLDSNSTWTLYVQEQGSDPDPSFSVSIGGTMGVIRTLTVGDTADLGETSIGHITIHDRSVHLLGSLTPTQDEFLGFAGEASAERLTRLASENNVPLVIRGQIGETAAMGPQRSGTLLELMDAAAAADGGILHESRDELGLEYRTRESLYGQARRVTLDYTARGEVPPPLQPVEDDQQVRNDVTVTREGGSSARAVVEDGPLSVQVPPSGVGTYDEAVTLNLAEDGQLADVAAWRTHLGTWDEARYPTVTMWAHTAGQSNPDHVDAIASLDVGDRFAVTNPPAWLPPADIDQLAQGYKEVLKPRSWEIEVNASPARPWDVAVLDEAHADTDGSSLASAVDADDTALSVTVADGPLWTTDADDLPITISVGGEEMTVTAISGSSSPQAFTVARSVNGITKSHVAGADVRLAAPPIIAL